jgi:hypothetical protein
MDEFKYDVFKGTPKKNPLWLGSVNGLDRATELMKRMAARLPGDYFVSSGITTEVVAVSKQENEQTLARSEQQNHAVSYSINSSTPSR